MPLLTCPRCSRVNPEVASFCYFDGQMLRPAAGAAALVARELPREFFFASGRRCRTLDDFATGCRDEWDDARSLLRAGHLAKYLDGIGRPDLASNAREASNHADADAALYAFLQGLPSTANHGPRLDINPRRVVLPGVRTGDQRQVRISIVNQGQGQLQGKLAAASDQPWLSVATGASGATIQTARSQEIVLRVDARGLIAGQTYSGKLTAITNGGIAEVPVRLDVAALPFPRAPYCGAASPRELAEQMRANPKPAAALLEGGDVARWFAANGWTYPVPGIAATGLAAVQQFFEYLGLSKPPSLELSAAELLVAYRPGERAGGEVVLRTTSRKWVYVRVQSSSPWLRPLTPVLSGPKQVCVAFEVDPNRLDAPEPIGELQLIANGGQKHGVRIAVRRERTTSVWGGRLYRPLVATAIAAALWRLLLAVPGDALARGLLAGAPPAVLIDWQRPASAEPDFFRLFTFSTWWIGVLIGCVWTWRRAGSWLDMPFGAIAGAAAGVAVGATVGVLLVQLDAIPREFLTHMQPWLTGTVAGWPAAVLWVMLATACWASLGLAFGCLGLLLGRAGRGMLAILAAPIAGLCLVLGIRRLAELFRLD